MTKSAKHWISVVCLLTWPMILWAFFTFSVPSLENYWLDLVGMLILMITVSLFPIQVRGTNISLIQGISLAIFLQFGLLVELIMVQITILSSLWYLKYPLYRYGTSSLMFMIVSAASALVYYLLGGEIGGLGMNEYPPIIPVIGYSLTALITNHLVLHLIRKNLYKETSNTLFDKGFLWELLMESIILPVGITFYILYSQLGTSAILFVGVPFVIISLIVNMYHSSQKINHLLKFTNKIGQELTESLLVDETLDIYLNRITKMLKVDYAYILDIEDQTQLTVIRKYESDRTYNVNLPFLFKGEGISGKVWESGQSLRFEGRHQWRKYSKGFLPITVQSVVSVPMIRNHEVVGVITFASNQKKAYDKPHLMILEILSNYLAVALDKAKNYEATKQRSERCHLTNLYNYRYFEDRLYDMYKQYDVFQNTFSLILLDIDHFKRVNDTFGHQSGNEVLCQVADRLVESIGDQGTVARYGGEEFVILLPETNHDYCMQIAELLRENISQTTFSISNDLGDFHKKKIYLTVSIGVATAPEQGEDPLTLIRNADRAMYTGAKQQGRNKVASYIG
ncbi:sensor domain-containing diguanylate cyclase [Alkalihalobacillus sp. AL-G]|uniref:sensor domain-containing diguanylate cyclase n=1 Tax=Alkalihalobacillus sp. AL-G TaxID=2926399 RepID=UPI00272B84CB|nr:sensor domain-containing diguanylate cyclase [Alkalihalobacillus sp. AL-G]WLD92255.1 sensor domain-containing diguanylate cyclase [Alkalihalobacillus sp. AL-G]